MANATAAIQLHTTTIPTSDLLALQRAAQEMHDAFGEVVQDMGLKARRLKKLIERTDRKHPSFVGPYDNSLDYKDPRFAEVNQVYIDKGEAAKELADSAMGGIAVFMEHQAPNTITNNPVRDTQPPFEADNGDGYDPSDDIALEGTEPATDPNRATPAPATDAIPTN